MTTKVIITNPEIHARPIRVRLVDVAGAPDDVTVEAGRSHEMYIHATRTLEVSELDEAARPVQREQREHLEQFFEYSHLPPHLQAVSRPFCELARLVLDTLPRNPERTVALRKLVEAKDAAVRARVAKD